jgi:hypothetical protein
MYADCGQVMHAAPAFFLAVAILRTAEEHQDDEQENDVVASEHVFHLRNVCLGLTVAAAVVFGTRAAAKEQENDQQEKDVVTAAHWCRLLSCGLHSHYMDYEKFGDNFL